MTALPGEFVEGARAHAVGERGFAFDLGVAAVGEEVGVLGCHLTCNDTMMFRPKNTLHRRSHCKPLLRQLLFVPRGKYRKIVAIAMGLPPIVSTVKQYRIRIAAR